jgi:hypothetical protein
MKEVNGRLSVSQSADPASELVHLQFVELS